MAQAPPPSEETMSPDALHRRQTLEAYEALAPVWSASTDQGAFNGFLERPGLQAMVPKPLEGARVLDAGCAAGTHSEWLADEGAEVVGLDLSPSMVAAARRRLGGRGRFFVADLAQQLELPVGTFDGVVCSLALHYLEDWTTPLASFARLLRAGGWMVVSLDHPAAPTLAGGEGGYFHKELVAERWEKDGVTVTQRFWRRPLEEVAAAFAQAGFATETLCEPRPSREALARFPDELAMAAEVPGFIVYRLRRLPVGRLRATGGKETFGPALYGDPCRQCGFSWPVAIEEATATVARAPERYRSLLEGADPNARHRELEWNASAYVSHVGDNLRLWAQRLAGAALGGDDVVPGYDPDMLGAACAYNELPAAGALWSLAQATAGWLEAVELAARAGVELLHLRRGALGLFDVVRANAHDVCHHAHDIERITAP